MESGSAVLGEVGGLLHQWGARRQKSLVGHMGMVRLSQGSAMCYLLLQSAGRKHGHRGVLVVLGHSLIRILKYLVYLPLHYFVKCGSYFSHSTFITDPAFAPELKLLIAQDEGFSAGHSERM